jgi:hypothetical protein
MNESNTPSTPDTEFSAPCSPPQKIQYLRDTRSAAKEKLSQLTLEEKVYLDQVYIYTLANIYRSRFSQQPTFGEQRPFLKKVSLRSKQPMDPTVHAVVSLLAVPRLVELLIL